MDGVLCAVLPHNTANCANTTTCWGRSTDWNAPTVNHELRTCLLPVIGGVVVVEVVVVVVLLYSQAPAPLPAACQGRLVFGVQFIFSTFSIPSPGSQPDSGDVAHMGCHPLALFPSVTHVHTRRANIRKQNLKHPAACCMPTPNPRVTNLVPHAPGYSHP